MAAVRAEGQRVVIVGGGAVAQRRARLFSDHGAIIKVYDPYADETVDWPERVTVYRRRATRRDIVNAWLVVVATNDPDTNARIGAWADELGLECNRADDVDEGTFAVPALIENEAGWQLAILGGEAGPLFSTWMKGLLAQVVSLPRINQVYRALAAARTELTYLDLTQEQRAAIMKQVMARALESEDEIDAVAVVRELL